MTTREPFYAALIRIRTRYGMTQEQLAAASRILPKRISALERGYKPTLDQIRQLCAGLRCSADDLLGIKRNDMRNANEKSEYLGDSIYASVEGGMIRLDVNPVMKGLFEHTIYFEQEVLTALINFAGKSGFKTK